LAIDAAKRAGAAEIIPILPYFPYARQDKKDQVRGPIGAKVMAEMLEQRGATQIITFDLHADQIQGFFNIPVVHMEGKYLFDRYVYDVCVRGDSVRPDNVNVVLCAPDAGAAKRVKHFRDQVRERWQIDLPMVMIDKTRPRANEVGEMVLIGDVKGKSVIIIDDMCDTGGTLVKAASELLKEGAESVRAIVTHGVLSGPALSRIWDAKQDGVLSDFVCSDSLPVSNRVLFLEQGIYPKANDYITVISTAKQIVKAIKAINDNRSVEVLKHVG
jgi:ribose-phosphate pyrophosphokinase